MGGLVLPLCWREVLVGRQRPDTTGAGGGRAGSEQSSLSPSPRCRPRTAVGGAGVRRTSGRTPALDGLAGVEPSRADGLRAVEPCLGGLRRCPLPRAGRHSVGGLPALHLGGGHGDRRGDVADLRCLVRCCLLYTSDAADEED